VFGYKAPLNTTFTAGHSKLCEEGEEQTRRVRPIRAPIMSFTTNDSLLYKTGLTNSFNHFLKSLSNKIRQQTTFRKFL